MNIPLPDIETEADVATLVSRFYERVRQDPDLGPVFDDVAQVNWPEHLPRIIGFWSTILFGTEQYRGNPMLPHLVLAQKTAIQPIHFERWLALFQQTLTERFAGERAEHALLRAQSIALVMQNRMRQVGLLADGVVRRVE